jgi:hypothetical protein
MVIYFETYTIYINTVCGQNVEFVNANPYGKFWALRTWCDLLGHTDKFVSSLG